jgi:hypothetical protein
MNLQFLRHRISTRTESLAVSSKIAAFLLLTVLVSASSAWAQQATRTALAVASEQQGAETKTTFTAKVTDISGNPVSTGAVSLEAPNGSLGSAFVDNGTATINLSHVPANASAITALYQGTADYAASRSASTNLSSRATTGAANYSIAVNPGSVTLKPGAYATISVVVTPENGFTQAVNLSCSSVPAEATCTFTPQSVTPSGAAPVTSSLQFTTTAASGTEARLIPVPGNKSHIAYAVLIPAVLAFAGIGALRRRSFGSLRVLGFLALLAASTFGMGACSARYSYLHHPPSPNNGTVAGNYTVTIASYATNGAAVISQSTTLAVIVN